MTNGHLFKLAAAELQPSSAQLEQQWIGFKPMMEMNQMREPMIAQRVGQTKEKQIGQTPIHQKA
jgi:hypothetical protein